MTHPFIDDIFQLFHQYGDLSYGEETSQRQHALQVAELARRNGCPSTLIVASLLHDIGQFLDDAGHAAENKGIDAEHEIHGAAFLQPYFPKAVTEPVRLHVAAKRYFCTVSSEYLSKLSAASRLSFDLQGGLMSAAEAKEFKANAFFTQAIQLRQFDDIGKHPDWQVRGLDYYRPMLEELCGVDA